MKSLFLHESIAATIMRSNSFSNNFNAYFVKTFAMFKVARKKKLLLPHFEVYTTKLLNFFITHHRQ